MKNLKTHKFKTTNIKGKEYIDVCERVKFLREYLDYELTTEYKFIDNLNAWVVKATLIIHTEIGGNFRTYTGLAQETIGDSFINKTSALENAETSAIGRACASAGIGLIDSIASSDEIRKANNTQYKKPELKEDTKQYEDVVKALANGYTIEQVEQKYTLTEQMKTKLS